MKTFKRRILHSTLLVTLVCSGCSNTQQSNSTTQATLSPTEVAALNGLLGGNSSPRATDARSAARPTPKPTSTPSRAEKRRGARRQARAERKARREKTKAEERAKAEARANAAFDVPALLGKTIEQVHDRLGPVEDSGPEDDDGEMSWSRGKAGLLVHYDPATRETTGFFINDQYGQPLTDRNQFLTMGGLQQGDSRYTLEFVPMLGSDSEFMGVRIIPN